MEQELQLTRQTSKIDKQWPKIHQFLRVLEPKIQQVADETALSYDHSQLLLILFDGDYQKLVDNYYNDMEGYKRKAGIPNENEIKPYPTKEQECVWCMMPVEPQDGECLECGHLQCRDCWKEYIEQEFKIKHPFPKCLNEECHLKMTEGFLKKLLLNSGDSLEQSEVYDKYKTGLGKAIISKKQKLVPCSYGECSFVFEPQFHMFADKLVHNLRCPNGHEFCLNCGAQPHRPLQCEFVDKWNEKAGDGSMLDAFIKDNPNYFRCPKCNRVINYVSGCDQMTCGGTSGHNDIVKGQGCGHVFCWRCFQPWDQHKGGWSGCNKFKPKSQSDKERDNEKYMHYLQGYEDNRVMKMTRAQELLKKIVSKEVQDNYVIEFEKLKISSTQYESVTQAIQFLVSARQTLKWTYVYGYYKINDQQRDLFEHQQGLFEEGLQKLQGLLGEELWNLFKDTGLQEFEKENLFYTNLKQKINNQKVSTQQFKENLLIHLEELDIGKDTYKNIMDQMNFEKNGGQDNMEQEENDYGNDDDYGDYDYDDNGNDDYDDDDYDYDE